MPPLISDELYFLVQTVLRTGVEREPSGGQLHFSQWDLHLPYSFELSCGELSTLWTPGMWSMVCIVRVFLVVFLLKYNVLFYFYWWHKRKKSWIVPREIFVTITFNHLVSQLMLLSLKLTSGLHPNAVNSTKRDSCSLGFGWLFIVWMILYNVT